ncbi:MAG: hypothetical protein ABFC92_01335, partial [Rectinema sp.]
NLFSHFAAQIERKAKLQMTCLGFKVTIGDALNHAIGYKKHYIQWYYAYANSQDCSPKSAMPHMMKCVSLALYRFSEKKAKT